MDAAKLNRADINVLLRDRSFERGWLIPAFILVGVALLGFGLWWFLGEGGQTAVIDFYLLPWIALTTIVVISPSVVFIYKGKFNFFHPLVHAAWSYFFPAFVVGGLILAFRISQPPFFHHIQNPEYDIPLTFVYISLGFGGLIIGYYLPFGRWAGERIQKQLPVWDWQPNESLLPGLLLLAIGSFSTAAAFIYGLLGYQKADEIGIYDGLFYVTTWLWIEACFFLWLALFKSPRLNFAHAIVIGFLLITTLSKAALAGNRSSLVHAFIFAFAAFVFSERRIKFKHGVIGAILLTIILIVGTIYGTTFRHLKETEQQISFSQYVEFIPSTVDAIMEQDTGAVLLQGVDHLAIRLENVSSVAVVVSNYEHLQPYEASYGLDNNIWKDLATFFIPRFLWKDKPVASDPRKYGDLYFDYGENSFTITPMGDLLRNFGPIGVPLGMIILGIGLRFIYASLIEGQKVTMWRATLYFMLMFVLSYESFYGSILPYFVKISVVSIVGILIMWFFVSKRAGNTQHLTFKHQ